MLICGQYRIEIIPEYTGVGLGKFHCTLCEFLKEENSKLAINQS